MIIEIKPKKRLYEELIKCSDIFIYNGKLLKFKDSINLESLSLDVINREITRNHLIIIVVVDSKYYIKTSIDNKRKVLSTIHDISKYDFSIYTNLHLHLNDSIIFNNTLNIINPHKY